MTTAGAWAATCQAWFQSKLLAAAHAGKLYRALHFYFLMWPPCVYAASLPLSKQVELWGVVEYSLMAVVIIISVLGGVLNSLNRELMQRGTLVRPRLFIVSHVCSSLLAGLMVFLLSVGLDFPEWQRLGMMAFFCYIGSRAIERAWSSYADKVLPIKTPEP